MSDTTISGPARQDAAAEFTMQDPQFRADAYGIYRELREDAPVSLVRFRRAEEEGGGLLDQPGFFSDESWLVTRYDEGVAAMLDTRFTVDHTKVMTPEQLQAMAVAQGQGEGGQEPGELDRALGRNLLTLDPPDHTRLRRLVQPSFTAGALASLELRVKRIADDLLDAAEREAAERGESAPDRAMELFRAFSYPLPVTVISEMVGIPEEDRAKARRWTENLLQVQNADEAGLADIRGRLQEFADYLKDLFERRRRDPQDDLITRLVRAEEEGDKLSPDEMLSMVFVVYVAGFVTTVNLIGNGTVALLTHPDQLAAFRADPSLAANVVEETLRFWGPAESTLPRTALEDVEIGSATIRRGERMQAGLAAMNRDPERFADPDVYDVTRPDAHRHVAFGKGVHVCLGAPLARLEGKVAFEVLFGRYPELRLAVPADEVRWSSDLIRGFEAIPLLF